MASAEDGHLRYPRYSFAKQWFLQWQLFGECVYVDCNVHDYTFLHYLDIPYSIDV